MFVVPPMGALSGRDTDCVRMRRAMTGARSLPRPLEVPEPAKTWEAGGDAAAPSTTQMIAAERVAAVGAALCAPAAWRAVSDRAPPGHRASVRPPEHASTMTSAQTEHRGFWRQAAANVHPGIDTRAGWPHGGTSSSLCVPGTQHMSSDLLILVE
jgi:hypothetical protein